MKSLIFCTILLCCASFLHSQSPAVNFTTKDCGGVQRDLYSELQAGKIVVLCWVMPCGACITPARNAYNVVQSFAKTKPGRVVFYLIDDDGLTQCTTLDGWARNNGIGAERITISTKDINESLYGGVGMPHVHIVGPHGNVYFNGLDNNAGEVTSIVNAINTALVESEVPGSNLSELTVEVWPNPASDLLMIKTATRLSSVDIINSTGEKVLQLNVASAGDNQEVFTLDLSTLAQGSYTAVLSFGNTRSVQQFSLVR
jgi:hypothetical protein